MTYAATAIGASVIEKPITDDRFFEAVEHIWAIDLKDLKTVISNIKAVHTALGNPIEGRKEKGLKAHIASLLSRHATSNQVMF